VRQLQQLQQLMRANDFHNDPLAHNNAEFQIAARFDLLDPATTNETAACGGAFDAKVAVLWHACTQTHGSLTGRPYLRSHLCRFTPAAART
jgi:hypothetical protein